MRRLRALIAGLPRDSALMRSVDPERAQWGNTEELLAGLIEVVDYGNRLFVQANSRKGARQPKPIKVCRPTEHLPALPAAPVEQDKPPPRMATSEEMRAFFGGSVAYTPN